MPRAPKACAGGCGQRVVARTYCNDCDIRSPSSIAADDKAERRRRAEAVSAWVATRGWLCPGYRRPAHPSHDLTAAHSQAVAHGGAHSALTVLCRGCNASQGTTPTR